MPLPTLVLQRRAQEWLKLLSASSCAEVDLAEASQLIRDLIRAQMRLEAKRLATVLEEEYEKRGCVPSALIRIRILDAQSWDIGSVHAEGLIASVPEVDDEACPHTWFERDIFIVWLHFRASHYDSATRFGEAVFHRAAAHASFAQMSRAASVLATVILRSGDSGLAQKWYQSAAVFARLDGNPHGEASAEANEAICLKNLMAWGAAKFFLDRAIRTADSEGHETLAASARLTQGILACKSGSIAQAIESLRASAALFEKFGSSQANSARIALGNCYILSGQHRLAKKTLDQCLSVCESRGFARTEAIAHEYLGDLLFEQGKTRQALQQYNKALEIGMRIAPRGDVVVEAERRRAEALAMLSRYDEAEQALDHGEEVASAIPEPYEAAVMSRIRMLVAAGRGKREEIQQAYRVAREKIWAMDEMVQRGRLLESWAFVLAAWDEPAQRREVLYEARNFYSAAGAKGCFDRVTRKLEWERHAEDESSSKPRFRYGMVVAHVSTSRHLDLLERYKDTYMPVLILGETGTGKELFARAVHELRGNNGAWVAVNCGAMPRELVEAELFGVVRGAYTGAVVDRPGVFERAHNGTLFLDEVGELPPGAQTRLLRALECGEVCRVGDTLTRKVKFRLVAATHRDLRLGVLEGWFRGDLYYRLEGVVLKVLPLRERREEIEHIARHFLVELEHQMGRSVTVDDRFWESLRAREWPGNVRQLRRAMERAVFGLDVGEVLRSEHLDESTDNPVLSFQEAQDLEREKVMRALTRTNWNKTAASAIVGLKRTTLLALMKRLGIPAKKPA